MLKSLKQTGKNLSREITRTWESLSEGWRELFSRSSEALTQFTRCKEEGQPSSDSLGKFPNWGLLTGELEETPKDVLVRLEVPGMDKDDCQISIEGNTLLVRGEKRFEREATDITHHVMERAYGAFQRCIPLRSSVNADGALANLKNGVLTVRLPKEGGRSTRTVAVT